MSRTEGEAEFAAGDSAGVVAGVSAGVAASLLLLAFGLGGLIMISGRAGELKTISWGALASRVGAVVLCALAAEVMIMESAVAGLEAALMITTLAIEAAIRTPAVADTRAIPVLRFMSSSYWFFRLLVHLL